MECNVCKTTKEVFNCDECPMKVCKICAKLTSSEVKVLQLNARVMKFLCTSCRSHKDKNEELFQSILKTKDKLIESKEIIIESKNEIIEGLKRELELLKKNKGSEAILPSFSEVVNQRPCPKEVLVVQPKNSNQKSETTRKIIQDKINPSSLGVGIARTKFIKNGGIAISCSQKDDIKCVYNDMKKQLGEDYEIIIPEKKIPNYM